jgi:diguanylate cyclase (GGDEF)-like protein
MPIEVSRHVHEVRARAASDRRASADDRQENLRDRRASAHQRGSAAHDRIAASEDRQASDRERASAEADRSSARADRDASAADRTAADLDELTGAYRRGPGLRELERDVAKAVRTGASLAVAFVDVDHLKRVNDSLGHAAGDRLLQQVATALRDRLRPYDLVVRYGGDEFICVLAGVDAVAATARLATINGVLKAMSPRGSLSIGVAELHPGQSAAELVRRADQALYASRGAEH